MLWRRRLSYGLALGYAAFIGAISFAAAQQEFRPGIDCQCRGPSGRFYELQERACLRGPDGDRLATCVMNQNVTSWQFTNEPCTYSQHNATAARRQIAAYSNSLDQ